MKLFMHWDMEGASGIHAREQVWFWEPGAGKEAAAIGRDLLIADVNNATLAALDAGVDEIIVSDTHGGGGNLILERMLADPRVSYNTRSRGFDNSGFRWMPGLDESVDGFCVMAHHAKAGTPGAFLPHTNSGVWDDFSINGFSTGEMGLEACYAAHWGIPLLMMHGEQTACDEALAQFPGIVAVPVKRALDHDHCTGPDLDTAHRLVAEGVARAVANLRAGRCRPFAPKLPMTVTIRMKTPADADAAVNKRPQSVQRVDDLTVQGCAARHCDVMSWLSGDGLNMPAPDLWPPKR